MASRIGFDAYTIEDRQLSANELLEFAHGHGLQGVQFLEPSVIAPSREAGRLVDFRRQADALGLYLEVGLPCPNPVRRSRMEDRTVSSSELAAELAPQVEAVAALGCSHARIYVGDRHDRFRTDTPWPAQVEATFDVLRELRPVLRSLGVRVAIENHADLTVDELLALVDRLGPEVAGVTLDTGNLLMRLDDPVSSAERLAPLVLSTHVKDCVLGVTPRGLCWQARPVGSGILPMPDLLAPLLRTQPDLFLSIELHPRTYDLPINDESWLGYFPGLGPGSLACVMRLAEACEARYATGFFDRPEVIESIPWRERQLDWLASSFGYLRSVVPALTRLDPGVMPGPSVA